MLERIWNHLQEKIKSLEDMKMFFKKLIFLLFEHLFESRGIEIIRIGETVSV
jgi:hypothetical protein